MDVNAYDKEYDQASQRYQLRYAAGLYWLLDMEQPGVPYISPVPMNEIGAGIWRMIESGMGQEEIGRKLSEKYEISSEQAQRAQRDIDDFIKQLQNKKVVLGGRQ